jgi:plasmid stabilization system protein ParE
MNYTLVISPDAEADLRAIHNWYEIRSPGVGAEFLDRVGDTLELLRFSPATYAEVHRRTRLAPVSNFPYLVVYRVRHRVVRIIAVWHNRRDDTWRERI